MIRTFVAGLFFWFALTGLFSIETLLVGLAVLSLLVLVIPPGVSPIREAVFLVRSLIILPEAYRQGLLLLTGHNPGSRWTLVQAPPCDDWTLFTETFLVTLTPETLVAHINKKKDLVVHNMEVRP